MHTYSYVNIIKEVELMYVYHDQGSIDLPAIIKSAEHLAQLYGKHADYQAMKQLTDFIDGQTVEHIRNCLASNNLR